MSGSLALISSRAQNLDLVIRDVSDVFGAKFGSLAIGNDSEMGIVLEVSSDLEISMEMEENVRLSEFKPVNGKEK